MSWSQNDFAKGPDNGGSHAMADLSNNDRRSAIAAQDASDLARLGKKQQFKRNFGWLSVTGLTCCLMLTWEGSVLGFGPQLLNGGPAGLFGGFMFAWCGTMLQALVIAEMASSVPLSGGQYNWVAAFAPRSCSRFLSYFAGWQTALSWHSALAAVVYVSASSIQTLAAINNPSYEAKRWQLVLLMYAVLTWALIMNTYLGRVLPMFESVILLIHVMGFLVLIVVLIYLSPTKNPASQVFGDLINGGGWETKTLSFFVGTVGSILAFIGVDAAAHIAEEVEGASRVVPYSIVATVLINGSTGLGMFLTILFVMGDPQDVIDAYLGGQLPFATIFVNALDSTGAAAALGAIPVTVAVFGCVGAMTATSRMMWALARENAWPAASWISQIQSKNALPLNSILVTAIIDMLLALIVLGSETAFNAFAGMAVQGYFTVFMILAFCGLYRKLVNKNSERSIRGPFHLGVFGVPITVVALAYSIVGFFFSFWPPVPNPPVDSFNWSLVAWVGTTVASLGYWQLRARKVYKGLLVEVDTPFGEDR